jgi:thymidine kinase
MEASLTEPEHAQGYLDITLGPMFAGKTMHIISTHKKYADDGVSIAVVNHVFDKRYCLDERPDVVSTHDLQQVPCIKCARLKEVWDYDNTDILHTQTLYSVDVILIDEAQFYEDLYDVVINMVNVHKKCVYVCGLDGDFNRQSFGHIFSLIPMCDRICKKTANCAICNETAIFSKKIDARHNGQTDVGGADKYMPVCRNCYHAMM